MHGRRSTLAKNKSILNFKTLPLLHWQVALDSPGQCPASFLSVSSIPAHFSVGVHVPSTVNAPPAPLQQTRSHSPDLGLYVIVVPV